MKTVEDGSGYNLLVKRFSCGGVCALCGCELSDKGFLTHIADELTAATTGREVEEVFEERVRVSSVKRRV